MLRNWKSLTLTSALTTTLFLQVSAPAVADDKAVLERIESLDKKIKDLESGLNLIRADLDALRKRDLSSDKPGLEDIKGKLAAIERALLKLQPSSVRSSMSPPAAMPMGRVVLANLYPEDMFFVVNNRRFRVLPGSNVPLDNVPAGVLNYEVISSATLLGTRHATALAPNQTLMLTATP